MFRSLVYLIAGFAAVLCGAAEPPAGSITVVVQSVRNTHGSIGVALFREGEGFPEQIGKAFRSAQATAAEGEMTFTLDQVPAGKYAIAVQHDENGNGKLDKNLVGMPTEGWGVSNNVRPRLRAPKFDEARFEFDGTQRTVAIKLSY